MLSRIVLSRMINTGLGGPFVWLYDVDELDDVTIDSILAASRGRPDMRAGLAKVESIRAGWLARSGYKHKVN